MSANNEAQHPKAVQNEKSGSQESKEKDEDNNVINAKQEMLEAQKEPKGKKKRKQQAKKETENTTQLFKVHKVVKDEDEKSVTQAAKTKFKMQRKKQEIPRRNYWKCRKHSRRREEKCRRRQKKPLKMQGQKLKISRRNYWMYKKHVKRSTRGNGRQEMRWKK